MKKLLYFLGCIIFLSFSKKDSGSVEWKMWEEVEKNSESQKKLIMVYLYTDWCGWCRKLETETFSDEKVISRLNAGFNSVKVNPEKKADYLYNGITMNYRVFTDKISHGKLKKYPLLVFIDPTTKKTYFQDGFISADEFYDLLDKVRKSIQSKK